MIKQAIGLLGGTFDPIHIGHLRSAIILKEQLGLSEVRLLPNYIPPHKASPDSAPHHRLAMVELAVAHGSGLSVDARELKRDRPSYTVETLAELRQEHPNTPLCFLMGMDSFCSLNRWHRWQELLNYAHLVVSQRPGWRAEFNDTISALYQAHGTQDKTALHQRLAGHIYLLDNPQLEIASSQIRQIIYQGNNPQYLLPDSVAAYIQQQGLYQAPVL